MKKDISTLEDIQLLVDSFYTKVRANDLLGPVFEARIQDRWDEHLQKMYRFWQTILLDERTYSGNPFMPHATLPIDQVHFEEWVTLFVETLHELFQGGVVEEAIWRANRMSEMFQMKLAFSRENGVRPIV